MYEAIYGRPGFARQNHPEKKTVLRPAHAAHMLFYTDPNAGNQLGRFYRTFQFL
jgi:hypothetical protein